MSGEQLPLYLQLPPRLGRGDFLPAPPNAAALAAITDWAGWPARRMIVHGPSGSGRSHIAAIWAEEAGATPLHGATLLALPRPEPAYAIDDADAVAGDVARQETLFHLLNRAKDDGASVLMTARDTPGTWGLTLPDLESRLLAVATTALGRPDDALLRMVLVKLFDERQLEVGPETLEYLCRRLDRSLAAAREAVDALDRAALSRQKRVSRPLAAETLARIGQTPPD